MTYIFVRFDIPGYDQFLKSIRTDVTFKTTYDNEKFEDVSLENISRVGFVYDNNVEFIQFGSTIFVNDNYKFLYFRKELVDLFKTTNRNINVDLITCDLDSKQFIDEVSKLKQIIPNVEINYSINPTGNNSEGGDWITESNNKSIKDIYFNDNINGYGYVLGQSSDHAAFIANDTTVWTFGKGSSGQLGNGTNINSNVPVQVTGITNAIYVACSLNSTAIIKDDGTLWTCGDNTYGQLGDGTTISSNVPIQVPGISTAVQVATGNGFMIVLLSDGTLRGVGNNSTGQLGIGTNINSPLLITLPGVTNAKYIECGSSSTFYIDVNGNVFGTGSNLVGQLGNNSTISTTSFVQMTGITNAISVSSGFNFTVVIKSDGTVWSVGSNANGRLGDGSMVLYRSLVGQIPGITNAIAASCGSAHTIVLLADGSVISFGQNASGQLGNGNTTSQSTPVSVIGSTNIIAIGVTQFSSIMLKNDGTIVTFGRDNFGQLGDGTNTNSSTAVSVILQTGQKVYRVLESKLSSMFCIREDNLVKTSRGMIPIRDVISGDTVFDENNKPVNVEYNIKMALKTKKFIKIRKKVFFGVGPSNDLYLTNEHPIKILGYEMVGRTLLVNNGVTQVTLDKKYYVYSICTEERIFINVENIPVCTVKRSDWEELTNKNGILWFKQ
jgi:alpha-tubulin suppressor-like RCC1 family protein